MCEILVKDGRSKIDFTLGAFEEARNGNPHGAGYMLLRRKKGQKFKLEEVKKFGKKTILNRALDDVPSAIHDVAASLSNEQLLIAHFRFATHGIHNEENTHPIETDKYVVIHNGVFHKKPEIGTQISDTVFFARALTLRSRGLQMKSYQQEQEFIQSVLEEFDGWYSLYVYSKDKERLYYFRNGGNFRQYRNGLLFASDGERFPR